MERVPPEVLVIVDEAYKEFVDKDDYGTAQPLLETYTNLMVLGTFGLFLWERTQGADIETARTVADAWTRPRWSGTTSFPQTRPVPSGTQLAR